MTTQDKPFEIIDALNDIKAKIDALVDDPAVIIYNQEELEQLPSADPRLVDPNKGFLSIMYAGMRPASNNVQGNVSTVGRFVIVASFKNDRLRVKGLENAVTMIRFMSLLRRALAQECAPNNKRYTFKGEGAFEVPGKGDGYMQEWNLSLTTLS